MKTFIKIAVLSIALAIISGCAMNPETGEREFNRTAIGVTVGGVAGGLLGAAVGGDKGAMIGAAAGMALGGGTGWYMQKRADKLKAELKGTGIDVQTGVDKITGEQMMIIQAPADVAFASSSADLQSSSFQGLSAIANMVKTQPGLKLEITGHTDSTGGARFNQMLSASRAQSVAQYVSQRVCLHKVSAPAVSDQRCQSQAIPQHRIALSTAEWKSKSNRAKSPVDDSSCIRLFNRLKGLIYFLVVVGCKPTLFMLCVLANTPRAYLANINMDEALRWVNPYPAYPNSFGQLGYLLSVNPRNLDIRSSGLDVH